jgi:hypothetical protein
LQAELPGALLRHGSTAPGSPGAFGQSVRAAGGGGLLGRQQSVEGKTRAGRAHSPVARLRREIEAEEPDEEAPAAPPPLSPAGGERRVFSL